MNRYLNIGQVAEYSGFAVQTIYRWVSKRKIPFYKFGKSVRFSLEEIDEWIKNKRVKSTFDFAGKF